MPTLNLSKYFGSTISVKGVSTGKEHEKDYAEGPEIAFFSVITVQNLRTDKIRCASYSMHVLVFFLGLFSKSKVDEFDFSV